MDSESTETGAIPTGSDQSRPSVRAHRSLVLRWAGGFLVLVAVVLLAVTLNDGGGSTAPAATPSTGVTPSSGSPDPSQSSASPSGSPYRRGTVPTGLVASPLGVQARVVSIASVGDTLTPPSDVSEVGWWSGGARAGASRGSVLLTGHTVHTGGGVFDDLGDLERGQSISVGTGKGDVDYRVQSVHYLTKAQLAAAAPSLFDPRGRPQLVLVTCESWDGSEYDGNTVVVATPVTPA